MRSHYFYPAKKSPVNDLAAHRMVNLGRRSALAERSLFSQTSELNSLTIALD
ncbi:hypothetical protein [Nostoc sp. LPT]|uniref:hypothetical protein n=1 Tax=Nostoc sp. LPT TaxID=2815387 RepID=UPI001DD41C32|nr:hypothetical protein [Nostoc sp. LPT]MBN4006198.1 hypothetical protein [Nostoc sp. LPT]